MPTEILSKFMDSRQEDRFPVATIKVAGIANRSSIFLTLYIALNYL